MITYDNILKAIEELKQIENPTANLKTGDTLFGIPVIVNPMLPPNAMYIVIGKKVEATLKFEEGERQ